MWGPVRKQKVKKGNKGACEDKRAQKSKGSLCPKPKREFHPSFKRKKAKESFMAPLLLSSV